MFAIMNKVQTPVLIVAGLATCLLMGIGSSLSPQQPEGVSYEGGLTPELHRSIKQKIYLGSLLSGRELNSDKLEDNIQSYFAELEKCRLEGHFVSQGKLREFIVSSLGSPEGFDRLCSNLKARNGFSQASIVDYFRDVLLMQKSAMLHASAAYVTHRELLDVYAAKKDSLSYDFFEVDQSAMKIKEELSEDEQKTFYLAHQSEADYQRDEEVQVKYLFLPFASIQVSTPTDSDLRDFYNSHRDQYASQEFEGEAMPYFEVLDRLGEDLTQEKKDDRARYLVSLIDDELIEQEKPDLQGTLQRMMAKNSEISLIQYGETDTFVAKDYFVSPFGYVAGRKDSLIERLFGEKVRSYGGMMRTRPGYFIYQESSRKEKRTLTFEECTDTVLRNLEKSKREELALSTATSWIEDLKSSTDWGQLKINSESGTFYQEKNDVGIRGLAAESAAALQPGEVSQPIKLAQSYAVVRLIKRTPAEESGLAEVESEIRDQISREKSFLLRDFIK